MAVVRCKTCGTDHAYRDDVYKMSCEGCGFDNLGRGHRLTPENTKIIIPPRETRQADPLDGM